MIVTGRQFWMGTHRAGMVARIWADAVEVERAVSRLGHVSLAWDWQVRPKGWFRLLGPLVGPLGGRMERRIWTGLKHKLENDGDARTS
jgi:hypothetical protein